LIKAIILAHPQSADLLAETAFDTEYVDYHRIACGTAKVDGVDFYESSDFFPTYASWNSALFETSVILTVWEHADQLIGDNNVAIVHSDVTLHFKPAETWKCISDWLDEKPKRSVGLTVPISWTEFLNDWTIPHDYPIRPVNDPFMKHSFDNKIRVWDFIKMYDLDIYEWAMDNQPRMIYSHQFACTRDTFDKLGNYLYNIASRLRLRDIGFWTPHMFERLIALFLAKYGGDPVLSTALWHHASSAAAGPGELNLYGPRALKFYQTCTRANDLTIDGDLQKEYDNRCE